MQKILEGVEVDFASMTLDELKESREKLQEEISKLNLDNKQTLFDLKLILSILNHQILMRKLLGHKYCPNS